MAKKGYSPSDQPKVLTKLIEEIRKLNAKIDSLAESNARMLKMQGQLNQNIASNIYQRKENQFEPTTMALLSLPASLRKTAMALYKFDEATADDLAAETKRLRAVESSSANQLVRMGYVHKKQEGRKVYFYIGQILGENRK